MMGDDLGSAVPATYREAAEEVRAHLTALRGGAVFLSPDDAYQLVEWFDHGVTVASILRALERAAEARRARRSRVPLRLGHARRHLGKPTRGLFVDLRCAGGARSLHPLVQAARDQAERDRDAALGRLAEELADIDACEPEEHARRALACIRDWLEGRYEYR